MIAGSPLASVAVFGDRTDIWPVATMLAASLPERVSITLVVSNSKAADRPVVLPASHRFFDLVDLDVRELVEGAGAAIGLGTDHIDWLGEGSSFFAAPSGKLPKINGVDLHQIMLRAAMQHQDTGRLAYLLEPFRFPAQTAKAGKFAWPGSAPNSPTTLLGPQVQMSANSFADLLEERMPADRVQLVEGEVTRADCQEHLQSVMLDGGGSIEADLFIDLFGSITSAAATNPVAGFPFDSIATHFDIDAKESENWHPSAKAIDGGLLIKTPAQTGEFAELFYSSDAMSESDVEALLGPDASVSDFSPATTAEPWTHNVIRMGRGSASFGPYHFADALILFEQIAQLASLLPARSVMTSEAAAYNAAHAQTSEQVRDRVLAPFVLNQRDDAVWSAMRQIKKPDSLSIRLDQFASRGRVARFEGELFDEQAWIDLLIGFGVVPERCDPKALALDMQQLVPIMRRLAGDFASTISRLPAHKPPFDG